MTDPRIDPASSPGHGGGVNPSASSGQRIPDPGPSGQRVPDPGPAGQGMAGQGMSGHEAHGAGAVSTTSRTTTSAGASVPQQPGEVSPDRTRQEQDFGTGTAAYAARDPGVNMLAKAAKMSWLALIGGAVLMIAVGVMLLVWPHASLTVVAVLIGAALVVSGLVKLYEGFTAREESGGMRAAYVVIGLLAVIAGLYCIRHHALSLFLVAFVAGVYFILHGIADLGVAFSAKAPGRGMRAVLGIFCLAAGVIMLVWPGLSLVLLLTIVGAWLILYGCVLGALAFGVRRAAKAAIRPETTTQAMPARAA
jgi:uncharacterized membrane protein HdeD (DUF308 family)